MIKLSPEALEELIKLTMCKELIREKCPKTNSETMSTLTTKSINNYKSRLRLNGQT